MKIRYVSDLHLEHQGIDLTEQKDDSTTVLVVAGDVAGLEHSRAWLESLSDRFLAVVAVLGNHDYWLGSIEDVQKTQPGLYLGRQKNVHILHRSEIRIEDPQKPNTFTRFVGATLWCNPPVVAQSALQFAIKDYSRIRKNHHVDAITPVDIVQQYEQDLAYLDGALRQSTDDFTVVVTHYPPSYQAVDPRYAQHPNSALLNTNYFNNLDYWIEDKHYDLWFHGHVHCSHQYALGSGQVYCNPRGYAPRHINPQFDDTRTIDTTAHVFSPPESLDML